MSVTSSDMFSLSPPSSKLKAPKDKKQLGPAYSVFFFKENGLERAELFY